MVEPDKQFKAQHKNWLMCEECGELQAIVALSPEHELACFNCGNVLNVGHGKWLDLAIALTVTAAILFYIANAFPFLTLEIGSQSHTITIIDGFFALIERENWVLATLIITTIFIFPVFEIIAFLYVLVPYKLNIQLKGQRTFLRWLIFARGWSMMEIFLLSMVIGSIKMADMAVLHFGVGSYALFSLVGVLLFTYISINKQQLWQWINPNNYFSKDDAETVYNCRICHAMVGESIIDNEKECPRCHAEIHRRIPHSLQKTTALIIASIVLYIPANILPIMTYDSLGEVSTSTIFGGVIELIVAGLYGIAAVVFIASIFVPILKLVILIYLVWSVKMGMTKGIRHRAFLYRVTETIGRWSMVDVFVVTIFVAIVQFGFVYTVEPEGAIIAFGAVVVLTMIAAETFDPRLLWDALDEKKTAENY